MVPTAGLPNRDVPGLLRRAGPALAVGVGYFLLAMGGLTLASINPSATPVWPATGLAIGALLVWGNAPLPAIVIAAFAANLLTAGTPVTAAVIAAGNGLEAAVTALFIRHWAGGARAFETPGGVLRFAATCLATGTLISPTAGVGALTAAGLAEPAAFWPVWLTWWLGDVAGALAVTPAVVLWAMPRQTPDRAMAGAETEGGWTGALIVYGAAVAIGALAFSPLVQPPVDRTPLAFLAILPLMAAALRRNQRDTATVALILSAFAVWGTVAGSGAFAGIAAGGGATGDGLTGVGLNNSLLRLASFLLAATVPSLALAAEVAVRHGAEARLRRRNAALAAREAALLEAQDIAGIGRWTFEVAAGRIEWSDEVFRIFGRPRELGPPSFEELQELLHPEDRPKLQAAVGHALATGEGFELEWRAMRPDGTFRWKQTRARAFAEDDGRVARLAGTDIDITERKAFERHQSLLVAELNHRVKNTLATVQAIAELGLRQGVSPEIFAEAFRQRLTALARAHDLLSHTAWEGADLGDTARQVLSPFGADTPRIALDGPTLRLAPNVAVALSMGINELATNAAKYGALSTPRGRVAVTWRLEPESDSEVAPHLVIEWRESGGPAVAPPQRKGFGSRLIERGLAHELAADIHLEYPTTGVTCRIRLPGGRWAAATAEAPGAATIRA